MGSGTILVAYGEIALKGRYVRSRLERLLARQIEFTLSRRGFEGCRVLRRYGRLCVEGAAGMPVLRPLIGLDKVEIEEVARRIGTYDISARSVDGCTVVPDRPATRARPEQVAELEEELGLRELCMDASRKIVEKSLDRNRERP